MERSEELVRRIGMFATLKGYHYAIEAINIVVKHKRSLLKMKKDIYDPIARNNATTGYCVDHAIRTAIRIVWDRGNQKEIKEIFSEIPKPPNGEFFDMAAAYILRQEDAAG